MPRRKTYLAAEIQCMRTIDLATEWVKQITPFIQMLPALESFPYDRTAWNRASKAVDLRKNVRFKKSIKSQLEHFWGDETFDLGLWQIGLANKHTKHLIKNDIVLILMNNGVDRLPIFCSSTKGKNLAGYYIDTNRLGSTCDVDIVELPGELIGKQLTHPDAQAFMLKLRADVSAAG